MNRTLIYLIFVIIITTYSCKSIEYNYAGKEYLYNSGGCYGKRIQFIDSCTIYYEEGIFYQYLGKLIKKRNTLEFHFTHFRQLKAGDPPIDINTYPADTIANGLLFTIAATPKVADTTWVELNYSKAKPEIIKFRRNFMIFRHDKFFLHYPSVQHGQ